MTNMESIKDAKYADNSAGRLLRLAHEICAVESSAGLILHKTVSWQASRNVYGGLLGLAPAELKLAPQKQSWLVEAVTVRLDDDGELSFRVERNGHEKLSPDSFLDYYVEKTAAMFREHCHSDCVARFEASQPIGTPLVVARDRYSGQPIK